MPSGGSRAVSGPPAREGSGRSEARGFKLNAISAAGYKGRAPKFPLPQRQIMRWVVEGKSRYQVLDSEASAEIHDRELELWRWAWRTPQALVWSRPEFVWMQQIVARWVRQAVLCEGESSAADHGQLHRYAEQVGLTAAGLTRLGWKIVDQEPPKPRTSGTVVEMQPRRLRG